MGFFINVPHEQNVLSLFDDYGLMESLKVGQTKISVYEMGLKQRVDPFTMYG